MRASVRRAHARQVAGLICLAFCVALLLVSLLALLRVRYDGGRVVEVWTPTGREAVVETPIVVRLSGSVDPNTADAGQLTALPGIGPVLAQAVLEERSAGGPFAYPEDLLSVRGIGEKRLEAILPLLRWEEDGP